MPLTCLIVDDSLEFFEAARQLLAEDGVTVVGLAAKSDEAVEAALALQPDVALVDIDLGAESGFDVARRLAALPGGGPPVVLISASSGSGLEELVDASAARGFVSKTDLSGDASFRTLLGRVRAVALGAYEHQDLPFEMVVEALQPPRDPSRTPLFQVMFVLQNNRLPDVAGTELSFTPLEIDQGTGTAKFDLTLVFEESAGGLAGGLEYNTDLFDASTITRMIGHFANLLESIAGDPDRRLTELPWLGASERRQVLETWSSASPAAITTAATVRDGLGEIPVCIEQTVFTPRHVCLLYELVKSIRHDLTYFAKPRNAKA